MAVETKPADCLLSHEVESASPTDPVGQDATQSPSLSQVPARQAVQMMSVQTELELNEVMLPAVHFAGSATEHKSVASASTCLFLCMGKHDTHHHTQPCRCHTPTPRWFPRSGRSTHLPGRPHPSRTPPSSCCTPHIAPAGPRTATDTSSTGRYHFQSTSHTASCTPCRFD